MSIISLYGQVERYLLHRSLSNRGPLLLKQAKPIYRQSRCGIHIADIQYNFICIGKVSRLFWQTKVKIELSYTCH